jgi:hypothetical protein
VATRTGSVATRTGSVATLPSAPTVIYHRGSPIVPDAQRNPASAYDRAGVAVPGGLSANPGASPGTAYIRGGAVTTQTPGDARSKTGTPQLGGTTPATGGGTMRTTPAPPAPPATAAPPPPATAKPAPRAAPPATGSGIVVAHPVGGPKH